MTNIERRRMIRKRLETWATVAYDTHSVPELLLTRGRDDRADELCIMVPESTSRAELSGLLWDALALVNNDETPVTEVNAAGGFSQVKALRDRKTKGKGRAK